MNPGRLVVVGTPLGNLGDLSPRAIEVLADADVIACEDTRRTGKLLTLAGIAAGGRMVAVHEHNEAQRAGELVARLRDGAVVALVSDAGMPTVSDPGQRLVAAAVDASVEVVVVPGPVAAVAALAISALSSDRFVFEGFLPRKGTDRRRRLAALGGEERTIVLYEAPHRMVATVADLGHALGGDRRVALARELTKLHEHVWRGTLDEAAAHLGDQPPRGEFVVVVDGAPPEPPADDAAIVAAVARHRAEGAGAKAAAAAVATELGVSARRAYQLGLEAADDDH